MMGMRPLKLRWGRKSGRYDLSQDIYVLTVNLGDRTILQCTLATESTAIQCLDYMTMKLDLNQVEMFGLRYQMKCSDPDVRMMRWVELEKPLRKQLEKWACKPRQVQLAVLYHTPNAFTLTDQMARSCYFQMMKLDVVEGRLAIDMEKCIKMAAHSLQVDYGDREPSIHTIEFLQGIPLLPKHICRSAQILEDLLWRVSNVYESLRGMQPSHAALLYIVDACTCEGYGEEYFNARDEDSTEVKIGYSPEGIVVKPNYGAPLKYKWENIKDFKESSKRNLTVRCFDSSVVHFTLEDAEMARYVAMLFRWQLRYATTQARVDRSMPYNINNLQGSIKVFQQQCSRLSNLELNNVRPTDVTLVPSTATLMQPQYAPYVAQSMCNINSVVNQGDNRKSISALSSVSFRQPISVMVSPERQRAATTTTASAMLSAAQSTPTVHLTTTGSYHGGASSIASGGAHSQSPVYRPPPYVAAQVPLPPETQTPLPIDYRQLISQHKAQLITAKVAGSSPEIHMMGTGQTPRSAAIIGKDMVDQRRGQTFTGEYGEPPPSQLIAHGSGAPSHALSSPDLLSKWQSTPDLISSVVTRYKLAIAQSQLENQLGSNKEHTQILPPPPASSVSPVLHPPPAFSTTFSTPSSPPVQLHHPGVAVPSRHEAIRSVSPPIRGGSSTTPVHIASVMVTGSAMQPMPCNQVQ